jgi:sugar O-acyltransferase (sialic acid O-acetyltransferase NeuD family)
MTAPLAIVGAGGHGREALVSARRANHDSHWSSIKLFDDRSSDALTERLHRIDAVLAGSITDLANAPEPHVIGVGDPVTRRLIADRLAGVPLANVIDPSAVMGDDVELAGGVLLFAGAVCTTNVRIGRHSHLNCGAIISHDCRIGDFVSLSPGVRLNGEVTIEDGAFLGTGAIVLPGCRVGQGAVVGAGAVVVDDVEPGSTVVGLPAR